MQASLEPLKLVNTVQCPTAAALRTPHSLAPDIVSACVQMLLQALLQVDPAQRPTAAAVCRDSWALDLPESPCDILDGPEWGTPCQHAMPQEAACPPRHESEGGPAQEQHGVECTAQAMQHLWLQQEALMNGARLFGAGRHEDGPWPLSKCCANRNGRAQSPVLFMFTLLRELR